MIINENRIVIKGEQFKTYSNGHFDCYWKGLIFTSATQNGKESVAEFCRLLETLSIEKAVSALNGNFVVVVYDKSRGKFFSFVDNSGLYKAFYSQRSISSSLLYLAKYEKLTFNSLDSLAVVEFLHFGCNHLQSTLFKGIKSIGANEIVTFSNLGDTALIRKSIPTITLKPEIDFIDFFRNFSGVVKNEKISCDLTGGKDSRMVACLLDYFGIDYELAISGIQGNRDIKIAEEVAHQLDHNLEITYHSPDTDSEALLNLFDLVDGKHNILGFHRLSQLHSDRDKRGITLALSGAGGEFFNDYWWLQDFPLYSRHQSNINKLYSLRIESVSFPSNCLTGHYYEISRKLRRVILERLNNLVLDSNTKTYDNIYLRFRMTANAGNVLTSGSNFFKCYAPLLEYDLVRYAFHLPRSLRFFDRFHRRIITEVNSDVAKIKTSDNLSTCSSKSMIAKDLSSYIGDKTRRLVKKSLEKNVLHRTYFLESPDNPELYSRLYEMDLVRELLTVLKDEGIVKKNIEWRDINKRYLGNFITLGMLVKKCNTK